MTPRKSFLEMALPFRSLSETTRSDPESGAPASRNRIISFFQGML